MGFNSGHHAGYWEQNPSGADQLTDGISIDPSTNAGARAEVFVKGVADGKPITRTSSGNGMVCDLEIRYSLGRDDHGIYTYAIFSHPAAYPATDVGESRFGAKLTPDFDWLSIDAKRNLLMPTGYDWDHGQQLNMKEARRLTTGKFIGKFEHKYDYSADQFDIPAFGWSSTTKHVGLYFVNPSFEFLSGGPTHVELTGHLDDGAGGDPTLLDYWRGTHYGGTSLTLAKGEEWSKVVGPILIYVNAGDTPQAMYADALAEARRQQSLWPFAWVKGIPYAGPDLRGTVTGKLSVKDIAPIPPGGRMLVGLIPPGEEDGSWQQDSKHYQFWVAASADGSFRIPNVVPGAYMLHALSDGVLGEFNGPKVTVEPGKLIQFAALTWQPIRYGKQLWEIGIPDRSGAEFFTGDKASRWGNYLLYAKLFPNDIHYTIGASDFRKDWFYEQVPNVAHGKGGYDGGDTTWTIQFNMDAAGKGTAIFRTGLCGVAAKHVFVYVNGKQVGDLGDLTPLIYNATINRDGVAGEWTENDLAFPAKLLKAGQNEIALKVPGGNVLNGVIYDYLRLELDETGKAKPAPYGKAGQTGESEEVN
jgi:rhamnogalacturonan endolyase